ncbi:hypothetical protein BDV25DRAFT_149515 [Aspergillus avenaceus]|uniref:Uncharacterized protein n=1 Tax=Aspergillus avenaceus TaxID=36643 RepID=A0A5N6U487_ASPAV|nr:hypothetical protein BDV25DRAFT_149515 [Aspergillus avenaceus]
MYPSSMPTRRYARGMYRRPYGPGGIGGLVKVAFIGTCTYLVAKKIFHAGQESVSRTDQRTAAVPYTPGSRHSYHGPIHHEAWNQSRQ